MNQTSVERGLKQSGAFKKKMVEVRGGPNQFLRQRLREETQTELSVGAGDTLENQ